MYASGRTLSFCLCTTIALGKDCEDILKMFGIDREITEEEKKAAMRSHPWLMEGCEIIPEHKAIAEAIEEEDRLAREAAEAATAAQEAENGTPADAAEPVQG